MDGTIMFRGLRWFTRILVCVVFVGVVSVPSQTMGAATIYWTDRVTGEIQSANGDGTNIQALVTGLQNPRGIAVDQAAGKMYWTEGGSDRIRRANLDGTNVEDLVTTGLIGPRQIVLDPSAGKMYWADSGTNTTYRADLDGMNVQNLLVFNQAYGVAFDPSSGRLYVSRSGGITAVNPSTLFRFHPDNPLPTLVSDGLTGPQRRSLALDSPAGKLYWIQFAPGGIGRANLDFTNVETVVTGLSAPEGLAIDLIARKVYWTDVGTGKIQRANLDGSNIEDVVTGLSSPDAIAIANQPVPVDHFKCYEVVHDHHHRNDDWHRKSRHPQPLEVTLSDQFESEEATIGRAVSFCNPVDKNREGIQNDAVALTCYEIKDKRPDWSRHPRSEARKVEIENQFGEETLTVGRAKLLCVPSTNRF